MTTPRARRAPAKRKPAVKAPPKPVTLLDVVKSGDRRASLSALRDHLAAKLMTEERDQASLARQLAAVLRDLDELPNLHEESTLDDLAQRRASRRAEAAGQ